MKSVDTPENVHQARARIGKFLGDMVETKECTPEEMVLAAVQAVAIGTALLKGNLRSKVEWALANFCLVVAEESGEQCEFVGSRYYKDPADAPSR